MSQPHYMLDTNTVSYLIKGNAALDKKLSKIPMSRLCISSITEAELRLGVAKKPEAKNLEKLVNEFLLRIETLPWNSEAARAYAKLRAACEGEGKPLGNMDMLIAVHSIAVEATLVTSDKAFYHLEHYLALEDWTGSVTTKRFK